MHAFAENHHSHGSRRTDARIAALANAQHGVVSRRQLYEMGLGRGTIEHRLRRDRLHRVLPEVYAVGHEALSRRGIWMAAVLHGGLDAALSHWSAARLWGLRSGTGPQSHVTVPRRRRRGDSVVFHYAALPADERAVEEGIPVTVPARVILDLARDARPSVLQRMAEQLERLRLSCGPSLAELLERYPRRAGTAAARALIHDALPFTRSDLEAELLSMVDAWGLPRPQVNANIAGYEVDFAWPKQRVIVELDTFETHGTSLAFERDRRRDRALQAAGWMVLRATEAQLTELRGELGPLLG